MKNKPEMNEVAVASKDITYSAYMGVLQSQDKKIAEQGSEAIFKQYDALEEDAMVSTLMQKRKMAVISREWGVTPASDSPQDAAIAEFVEDTLNSIKFDEACKDFLDAIMKGFAVSEIMWAKKDNRIVVDCLKSRNPARFLFDENKALRMRTSNKPFDGEEIPENKFVVFSHGGKYGNPYGIGLGSKLYWPVFFKKNGIRFWLTFAEKFGNPTLVGKYKSGAPREEIQKLMAAMRAFSNDTAVAVPEGMAIEMLEAMRTGSVDTYNQLVALMDKQMSMCVLGETLTTDIGSVGSKAASQTHNEVRLELVKADADLLCEAINKQLINPLVAYNFPNATPPKVWRNVEEQEDLNNRAERDKKLYEMGYKPTQEYVDQWYGTGFVSRENEASPQQARLPADTSFSENSVDAEEELSAQFSEVTGASLDEMIDFVKLKLNGVKSLDELRGVLPTSFSEMDESVLAEILSAGMTAAELQGRGDVLDEGES